MGQQQLLLIILGVIVVGTAVAVGITMFADRAMSSNRDAILNDLSVLASRAQQYYRRPGILGGGDNSFVGLTADAAGMSRMTSKPKNEDGSFSIPAAGDQNKVQLQAVGIETGINGIDPVKLTINVYADSVVVLAGAQYWN